MAMPKNCKMEKKKVKTEGHPCPCKYCGGDPTVTMYNEKEEHNRFRVVIVCSECQDLRAIKDISMDLTLPKYINGKKINTLQDIHETLVNDAKDAWIKEMKQ